MDTSINQVVTDVRSIIKQLQSYPDLNPSPEINKLFSWLVSIIYEHHSSHVDSNCILCSLANELPQIHRLCSMGEFAMECYWSQRIGTHQKSIDQFPYYQNYQKLVTAEARLLQRHQSDNHKRMLFVGSGPLPLSALLFSQNYQWQVDCLDKDDQAYHLGKAFIDSQPSHSNLHCIEGDIYEYQELNNYDLIVLGALVGSNHEQKQEILKHLRLHTHADTKLLVRSAEGLRTLLYPELKLDQITSWKVLDVEHPTNEVINSMVLLTKP